MTFVTALRSLIESSMAHNADAAKTAAQMLVDAGADVIVEASTGLTSIGMSDVLRRRLGRPVIDPVVAAGAMLVSAATARDLQSV